MSKLLQERWMRLAFAKDSTTVITEKKLKKDKDDPCETGWTMRGLKPGKDGGEVPNCVPQEGADPMEEADEMFSGLEEADASQAPEDSDSYTVTMTEADEADESFMGAIAAAAADGKDEVEIDGETFPVEMEDETVEAITGEKPKDPVEEAIGRWYNLLNEDGFDKEKKDRMKCNSPRRLRDGEPGHGEKSKVVKACDPGSDKESIVKFGDPDMPVQSHHADNKASFRARHKCADKSMDKDWNKAGYWACKDW